MDKRALSAAAERIGENIAESVDKTAIFGMFERGGANIAKRMGMSPEAQKGIGQFSRMAAPMVAGSYLQRSDNSLLSGIGTAMTYAPMFMGMMPNKLWGPDTPVKTPAGAKPAPAGPAKSMPAAGAPLKSMKATGVKKILPRTSQGLVAKPMVKMPKPRMMPRFR